MLRRKLCDRIVIEPEDKEDIEAVLASPENNERARLHSISLLNGFSLHVQVKSRGKAWSTADFVSLMLGKGEQKQEDARVRRPPIDFLKDPGAHFLLVTTSQAAGKHLDTFSVDDLVAVPSSPSLPDELAKAAQVLGLDPTALAQRICLVDRLSDELVLNRCGELLRRHGHVPSTKVAECLDRLEQRVWERLKGETPPEWTRKELEDAITDPEIGGRLHAPPQLMGFVPPTSLPAMNARLAQHHAVFLVGESGLGKTLCADKLIDELCRQDDPFELKVDPSWPEVDRLLAVPGRHLFYFEDPWGKYGPRQDREGWATELATRLQHATADKKFLWTSTWAFYQRLTSEVEQQKMKAHAVTLGPAHYPPAVRWHLALRRMKSPASWRREWLEQNYDDLLARFKIPMVLIEFIDRLEGEEMPSPGLFSTLARMVEVETISDRLAKEVISQGEPMVLGALVLWTLLAEDGALTRKSVQDYSRLVGNALPNRVPNGLSLLEWLKERRSLTELAKDTFRAHPRIQEGLEMAWRNTRHSDAVADVKLSLTERLITKNQLKAAVRVLKLHEDTRADLAEEWMDAVNAWLEQQVLSATSAVPLEQSLRDLAQVSTAKGPLGLVAKALFTFHRKRLGLFQWTVPRWNEEQRKSVSQSGSARHVIERYIAWLLGADHSVLTRNTEFPSFVESLEWKLPAVFLEGLERALSIPSHTADALAWGALQSGAQLDAVLHLCLTAWQSREEKWSTRVSREEWGEYILQPRSADFLSEEASDDYSSVYSAFETVVRWVRQHSDWTILSTHPLKERLRPGWLKIVEENPTVVSSQELKALIDEAPTRYDRDAAWSAVARSNRAELLEDAFENLATVPAQDLSPLASMARNFWGPALASQRILAVIPALPVEQRIEVLAASWGAELDEAILPLWNEHLGVGRAVLDSLEAVRLRDDESLRAAEVLLKEGDLTLLGAAALSSDSRLAGQALVILARAGTLMAYPVEGLLQADDRESRALAVYACAVSKQPESRPLLLLALKDAHYICRRAAVFGLAEGATEADWTGISVLASDKSALVRAAVAEAIGNKRWAGGLGVLLKLLDDEWDAEDYADPESGRYLVVAAAAAQALTQLDYSAEVEQALAAYLNSTAPNASKGDVGDKLLTLLMEHDSEHVIAFIREFLPRPAEPLYTSRGQRHQWAVAITRDLMLRSPQRRGQVDVALLLACILSNEETITTSALRALATVSAENREAVRAVISDPSLGREEVLVLLVQARILGVTVPGELEPDWVKNHPWSLLREWQRTGVDIRTAVAANPEVRAWLERLGAAEQRLGWALSLLVHQLFGGTLDSLTGYRVAPQGRRPDALSMSQLLKHPTWS
ncbi:HEAT repeat domain-containing protein [Corallococcus exiguus]|uniref:HEAT repeat domain-containing protein n=1 Tax=Corallococcus exiguus TaxID=83462 RepID=UPI0030B82978